LIKEFAPKAGCDYIKSIFTVGIDHGKNRELGKHQGVWDIIPILGMGICDVLLKDPETLEWIKNSKFDLVVIDSLANDCGIGLAYLFNAKHMIFGTTSLYMWHADSYGIFPETSWIPDMQYHPTIPMSFMQRLSTTVRAARWHLYRDWYMLPYLEKLFKKSFAVPNMPSIRELEKNVSLVLMNTHYSEEFGRSLPPLVVSVGGMHCDDPKKPLPQKILKFIEEGSGDGFIYVSFGSAVSISKLDQKKFKIFINAFKNSNVKFIWKWDGEIPKDLPSNILADNWLPQQEILAHKKIKGFITHGGVLGIHEAIYFAVPMILFPFFAEQDYNAERVDRLGHGIRLEITTLSQPQLEAAINSLLTDQSIRKKVQEVSKVFKDRPMKPLDLAVWWTEYILRNEDNSPLRPLGIHQTWYERRLLDVWAFVLLIMLSSGFLFGALIFLTFRKLICAFQPETEKQQAVVINKEKKL